MADQEPTEQTQPFSQEQEISFAQISQLKMRIETLEQELAAERDKTSDYMNRALRAQAEMTNVRKHVQQDIALARTEALMALIYEQLAVLDSFERAFQVLPAEFEHFTWVESIGLLQNQLYGTLHRVGLQPIESARGKPFNALEQEAVAYEETNDYPEETVTAELQRGYKFHDQVLRPALVKIARPASSGQTKETNTGAEPTQTSTSQT